MSAKELLRQAVRQVCEEAGEPWEKLDEGDFDETTIIKMAEVFSASVLVAHAAELDALRAENTRLRAELEAVGAEAFALKSRCEQLQSAMEGIEAAIAKVEGGPTQ